MAPLSFSQSKALVSVRRECLTASSTSQHPTVRIKFLIEYLGYTFNMTRIVNGDRFRFWWLISLTEEWMGIGCFVLIICGYHQGNLNLFKGIYFWLRPWALDSSLNKNKLSDSAFIKSSLECWVPVLPPFGRLSFHFTSFSCCSGNGQVVSWLHVLLPPPWHCVS